MWQIKTIMKLLFIVSFCNGCCNYQISAFTHAQLSNYPRILLKRIFYVFCHFTKYCNFCGIIVVIDYIPPHNNKSKMRIEQDAFIMINPFVSKNFLLHSLISLYLIRKQMRKDISIISCGVFHFIVIIHSNTILFPLAIM